MRRKVGDALLQLGITPDLKGFNYIIDMVEMIANGEVANITDAYKAVAKNRNESACGVERCIRHAISKINVSSEEFKRYVGINGKSITNISFLYTLHYRLKED